VSFFDFRGRQGIELRASMPQTLCIGAEGALLNRA